MTAPLSVPGPSPRSATFLRIVSAVGAGDPVTLAQFGGVGDGVHDDQKPIADLFDAASDGGKILLEGAPIMLVGETLSLSQRRAIRFTSDRIPHPDGVNVPRFIWGGTVGGTMFDLDRVISLELSGLFFETDDPQGVRAPASVILNLDGGQDTKGSGYGSECVLTRLGFQTHHPNPDLKCIAIAQTTQYNQELHRVIDCRGNGAGAGSFLYIGPSYNAKQIRAELNTAMGYDKAVWMKNGSLHLRGNNLSANTWNLYLEGASERCTEHSTTSEASQHHAYYNVAIKAESCRFDPSHTPAADAYIQFGAGAGRVKFAENGFDVLPSAKVATLYSFANDASHRRVRLEGNGYPWPATLATLGLDVQTLNGRQRDGSMHPEKQAGYVVLEDEGGITDLPMGNYRHNAPGS